jgi:pilus assembly protein CpaB
MSLTFSHSALERPMIVLPIAVLLLAAAGGVMWSNVTAHNNVRAAPVSPLQAPVATVTMLVSASDIPRGRVLNPQDVSVRMVPPAKAPAAALHRAEDAQGHMALAPIAAGSPILSDQISADPIAGLSARIPQSYRAYAIPVSEADIVGGFVQTGDHVDLYVTLPGALFAENAGQKPDDRSKATLLLQSVQVLAVGDKLKTSGAATPSVRTVTLALSATDLAKVALASRLGTITFAIRNPVDDAMQSASRAELSSLLGAAPAPTPSSDQTQARKSAGGIPFYSGRDRTTLHLP